jgi:hypothetical protein
MEQNRKLNEFLSLVRLLLWSSFSSRSLSSSGPVATTSHHLYPASRPDLHRRPRGVAVVRVGSRTRAASDQVFPILDPLGVSGCGHSHHVHKAFDSCSSHRSSRHSHHVHKAFDSWLRCERWRQPCSGRVPNQWHEASCCYDLDRCWEQWAARCKREWHEHVCRLFHTCPHQPTGRFYRRCSRCPH